MTNRLSFDALFASLLGVFTLFMPAIANAQKSAGKLIAPSHPTQIEVRERTISDLLYWHSPDFDAGMRIINERGRPSCSQVL